MNPTSQESGTAGYNGTLGRMRTTGWISHHRNLWGAERTCCSDISMWRHVMGDCICQFQSAHLSDRKVALRRGLIINPRPAPRSPSPSPSIPYVTVLVARLRAAFLSSPCRSSSLYIIVFDNYTIHLVQLVNQKKAGCERADIYMGSCFQRNGCFQAQTRPGWQAMYRTVSKDVVISFCAWWIYSWNFYNAYDIMHKIW